ncbi:MAG: N-acetyltransferase family protein, partial [Gemmatimonadota bacterium]
VPLPWLVAEQGGVVVGYAYAGKWKTRHGYRFTVESTVYLDPNHVGHGTGSRLYRALLDALRLQGVHSAIGGIGLPNEPSVRLHERLGFEKVAHFHENGIKFGRWIDVGYWQLVF